MFIFIVGDEGLGSLNKRVGLGKYFLMVFPYFLCNTVTQCVENEEVKTQKCMTKNIDCVKKPEKRLKSYNYVTLQKD